MLWFIMPQTYPVTAGGGRQKGLGGLSAFRQRWVIMADSTTGYGVIRGLPAAIAGTFWASYFRF